MNKLTMFLIAINLSKASASSPDACAGHLTFAPWIYSHPLHLLTAWLFAEFGQWRVVTEDLRPEGERRVGSQSMYFPAPSFPMGSLWIGCVLDLRSLLLLKWTSSSLHSFVMKNGNSSADLRQVACTNLCGSSIPCCTHVNRPITKPSLNYPDLNVPSGTPPHITAVYKNIGKLYLSLNIHQQLVVLNTCCFCISMLF